MPFINLHTYDKKLWAVTLNLRCLKNKEIYVQIINFMNNYMYRIYK